MKKASIVIENIQKNQYDELLKDIYVDEQLVENQKERYVKAIEKFISFSIQHHYINVY